jgi:PadR family transcriptional regulator PadR
MGDSMNLMKGTLDVLILNALADGPLHGYQVVAWIREVTNDALRIEDGALYTSLHRMEERGWLQPEWGVSPKGRRAKYYSLTKRGRKQLASGKRSWTEYAEAVSKVFAARRAQEA